MLEVIDSSLLSNCDAPASSDFEPNSGPDAGSGYFARSWAIF
jgi:hypothetical protein